jgi:hypothetical protein
MIDHHLMADLRKLKLGGFEETLELRVAQAEKARPKLDKRSFRRG